MAAEHQDRWSFLVNFVYRVVKLIVSLFNSSPIPFSESMMAL